MKRRAVVALLVIGALCVFAWLLTHRKECTPSVQNANAIQQFMNCKPDRLRGQGGTPYP